MPNLAHVKLMGILNVTPDSLFQSGKKNSTPLEIATQMIKDGAEIIDIGGESSGPNSKYVTPEEEERRVMPALKAILPLARKHKIKISIDTYKSQIADIALSLGADYINDVTGLRGDKKMASVIAKHKAKVIIMYSKDRTARTTKKAIKYTNVVKTIKIFFDKQIAYAESQGISRKNIILDPGMGAFISTIPKYSYEILDRLAEFQSYKLPILVGTSRKSMHPFLPQDRLIPSVATGLFAIINGASILRVHDVKEHTQAIKTFQI